MRASYTPVTVLYSLALALGLSLVFNGYLLFKLNELRRTQATQQAASSLANQRSAYWEQQWSDCAKKHSASDSLHHAEVNSISPELANK